MDIIILFLQATLSGITYYPKIKNSVFKFLNIHSFLFLTYAKYLENNDQLKVSNTFSLNRSEACG